MAVYAVGDIQGCFGELKSVLRKVHFDPESDVLWCVGDLVNRGPESLETLRFLKSIGDACICVLGNHDLHLLALAAKGSVDPSDSLAQVLQAPDCDALIDWLRHRPLLHHDTQLGWAMVHAGLHPDWTLKKAKRRAASIEEMLRGSDWKNFVLKLQKFETPEREPGKGKGRKYFSAAVLTRSRYCTSEGLFNWKSKVGGPTSQRERPWFAFDRIAWRRDARIVFGHWAARGLVLDQMHVLGLDSGCVWGGSMTLAELGRRGYCRVVAMHMCKGYHKPVHAGQIRGLDAQEL
ncbi:MAG: symmetrical bis(5'-nucleosyl)-tetraphosphatase [Zetaproteobacteria bacterium CG06_land_8_20_14_3_00_59_53]